MSSAQAVSTYVERAEAMTMACDEKDNQWIRLEKVEIPRCRVFVMSDSLTLLSEEKREEVWARSITEHSGPALLWMAALEYVPESDAPIASTKLYSD